MINKTEMKKSLEQFSPYEYERLYVQSDARGSCYKQIQNAILLYRHQEYDERKLYEQLCIARQGLSDFFIYANEIMLTLADETIIPLSKVICMTGALIHGDREIYVDLTNELHYLEIKAFHAAEAESQFRSLIRISEAESKKVSK